MLANEIKWILVALTTSSIVQLCSHDLRSDVSKFASISMEMITDVTP